VRALRCSARVLHCLGYELEPLAIAIPLHRFSGWHNEQPDRHMEKEEWRPAADLHLQLRSTRFELRLQLCLTRFELFSELSFSPR
jgi:hypothetical protein